LLGQNDFFWRQIEDGVFILDAVIRDSATFTFLDGNEPAPMVPLYISGVEHGVPIQGRIQLIIGRPSAKFVEPYSHAEPKIEARDIACASVLCNLSASSCLKNMIYVPVNKVNM